MRYECLDFGERSSGRAVRRKRRTNGGRQRRWSPRQGSNNSGITRRSDLVGESELTTPEKKRFAKCAQTKQVFVLRSWQDLRRWRHPRRGVRADNPSGQTLVANEQNRIVFWQIENNPTYFFSFLILKIRKSRR